MYRAKRKHLMDKLLLDIHVKREEMVACGLKNGFNDAGTLKISQELDILIVKYQQHKEQLDKPSLLPIPTVRDYLKQCRMQLSKLSVRVILSTLLK